MSLFYNAFTGTSSLGDVAWSIAQLAWRKFNIVGEFTNFYNSILWKIRALFNAVDGGSFSWFDVGGIILDLGEYLVTFIPAGRVADVVTFLWGSANIL
ncbi:hypothetical protein [Paenibacillus bouchesdurhonensis]|uniref:hypothetical protein n=1 Tax=Paenibacillus bouchesdurhonensis TaxID=1870990 RepID=UPI000DA5F758|nr:hypothetical protein [Paenibacillus bouchesdurhonensis]